jgi:putative addiction module killer protein
MIEVRQTDEFAVWLARLRDSRAVARIASRIRRVALGNFGDVKSVGDGVGELRIDYGPGYRLYIARGGRDVVVLLCGGDKSTQDADIARAKALAEELWR